MEHARINDLLEEATAARMLRAGNIGGELLNWIAMLGVIGDRKPRFIKPQLDARPRLRRLAMELADG